MKKIIMLMVVLFGATGGAWGGANVVANYTDYHGKSDTTYLGESGIASWADATNDDSTKKSKQSKTTAAEYPSTQP